MLTLYEVHSNFKKKITVVMIWILAMMMGYFLYLFMMKPYPLSYKVLPMIIVSFMILGIILRCKFARAFTLILLYALAFFPIVGNFIFQFLGIHTDGALLFLSFDKDLLFNAFELLIVNGVYMFLWIIPIYFLSNSEAMEIFYIEFNLAGHFFFMFFAIGMLIAYIYVSEGLIQLSFLNQFLQ